MRLFDSHAHYDDPAFEPDREALLSALPARGVAGVVNMGCDLASSRTAIALAQRYPYFHAAVGIHPENAAQFCAQAQAELARLAAYPRVVAIGEIGLDYHWPEPGRDVQRTAFRAQLALAERLGLPVCVHDRDAHAETMEILSEFPDVRGVLHCYTGAREMAAELVKMGWYIGFTGVVSFKNAKKARLVAQSIPISRILIETDCPYMAPEPLRGQRSDSSMLVHTAAALAAARGMETEALIEAVYQNARRFYRLDE
jgi:TatD DNase family protein